MPLFNLRIVSVVEVGFVVKAEGGALRRASLPVLGSLTPLIAKSLTRLYFFVKFYDFYVAICGYV